MTSKDAPQAEGGGGQVGMPGNGMRDGFPVLSWFLHSASYPLIFRVQGMPLLRFRPPFLGWGIERDADFGAVSVACEDNVSRFVRHASGLSWDRRLGADDALTLLLLIDLPNSLPGHGEGE